MIEITMLFLGSVIGAGFATGAEIITFFGKIQLPTWWIAIIVGLTIYLVIVLQVLLNYQTNKPKKIKPINTCHNRIGDIFFALIYFVLFTAMTAGITSLMNVSMTAISLVISLLIVLFGFHRMSRFNTYIVFVIIVLITTTAMPYLLSQQTTTYIWQHIPANILSAFLYAGLNCFVFPELIKAAATHHKRRTLMNAGALTAIIITILVGLILTTIKSTNTQNAPIPLLTAAPNFITVIVILLAILTSQYTTLFAINHRLENLLPKKKFRLIRIIGICTLAFFCSFFGFNTIINFAYPIIGSFTCVFLLFSWLKK